MKDLTKGKISTLILGFAIPVFLGNLLQLTYSLADTRIVGSFLGERSLAAVGATTTISNLIVGFLLGLANGFAIITAQKFGAGDKKRVRRSFAIALVLGVIVSAILILIGTVFINPILGFLNVPGKLFIEAKQYILIIIIGLWVTMFYDILMAVMRAIGDTLTPLLILAISVGLNIVLDLLFVAVWKTGTWGAAAATVLAQFIALVICCFYMIHKYELLRLNKNDFKDLESKMIKEMLATGMSMGFMSSLVNIGSLTLQPCRLRDKRQKPPGYKWPGGFWRPSGRARGAGNGPLRLFHGWGAVWSGRDPSTASRKSRRNSRGWWRPVSGPSGRLPTFPCSRRRCRDFGRRPRGDPSPQKRAMNI